MAVMGEVKLEVMRILKQLREGTSAPIGITQVVGFSMQNFSEQIEKRGQLASYGELFSLEAVSNAGRRYGIAASLVEMARGGLGRRGQVLNWIGAKRYAALHRE